jgi:DNA uptake protein ComE-like DNA-binding protein
VQFSPVAWVGEASAEALVDAGIETRLDAIDAGREELAEVEGIGASALDNIMEYCT